MMVPVLRTWSSGTVDFAITGGARFDLVESRPAIVAAFTGLQTTSAPWLYVGQYCKWAVEARSAAKALQEALAKRSSRHYPQVATVHDARAAFRRFSTFRGWIFLVGSRGTFRNRTTPAT